MAWYRSLAACGVTALLLPPTSSIAQPVACALVPGKELNGDLDIVAPCELVGMDVNGNVTIFAGGSLIARDVVIRGNLDASRAYVVDIDSSEVQGDVNLEELVGDASTIEQTVIGGDVLLKGNRSALDILNNDVTGSMQAVANTGGLTISGNSFEAGLNCSGNTPPPDGIGNQVGDEEEEDEEDEEDEEQDEVEDDEEEVEDKDKKGKDKKGKKGKEQDAGQCEDLPPEPTTTPPATEPPTPLVTITPAATAPPPTSTPPATGTPAATTIDTPPAPTSDTDEFADEGGVGALGWQVALLLPLLAWRRYRRRSDRSA